MERRFHHIAMRSVFFKAGACLDATSRTGASESTWVPGTPICGSGRNRGGWGGQPLQNYRLRHRCGVRWGPRSCVSCGAQSTAGREVSALFCFGSACISRPCTYCRRNARSCAECFLPEAGHAARSGIHSPSDARSCGNLAGRVSVKATLCERVHSNSPSSSSLVAALLDVRHPFQAGPGSGDSTSKIPAYRFPFYGVKRIYG